MPIVQNPSIGAGATALLTTTTHLTAAQILGLASTPVPLIPAPGAGKLIALLTAVCVYDFGTVPYVTAADQFDLVFNNGGGDDAIQQVVNLLTSSQSAFVVVGQSKQELNDILPGDDNSGIAVQTFGAGFAFGPISTATLGAGGLGYAPNDTGTIPTASGDATYQVLTVGAGGAVLTFSITSPGTAYATGNGLATATGGAQPGVGVGFTVNITAVQTGDGTLKVVTYYQIIPVP